jgi:Tfp pilus assembly ATPase PilU
LRNADAVNDLRLRIKLEGTAAKGKDVFQGVERLQLQDPEEGVMR